MAADLQFCDSLAYSVAKFSCYGKGKEYFEDGLVEPVKPRAGSKQNPEKLLSQITNSQLRLFTRKLLVKNPDLVNDLKIFLQGQKQTPVTVEQYKTRFRNQLDELNLRALIQAWYEQGEDYDYYDNGGYDIEAGGEAIADIVNRAFEEAEK